MKIHDKSTGKADDSVIQSFSHSVDSVHLRSEEVQEVMGKIPPWILRWGITLLFVVVLVLLTGSAFFRYPDMITSEMTLTGRYPVAQIVSRGTGRINRLYVADGQEVKAGEWLAVIENPARTEDVLSLASFTSPPELFTSPPTPLHKRGERLALGDIQPSYTSFLSALHEYENYYALGYYPQKIAATEGQIRKYRQYHANQQRQQQVLEAQHRLARQQYERDSLLLVRGVISPSEHETARSALLQSRYSLESGYASLENLQIQIGELETSLLDIRLQQAEKETTLLQNYRTGAEQLMNAIHSWELAYCLKSPIEGTVTFTGYWNENQFVSAGETVFAVVPTQKDQLIGKALLPLHRSGKVKAGQRVIVRFNNYPDQEFGMVNGVVSAISLVPSEDNYLIEITFPNGLTTNYGLELPVSYEMKASAEIVTEELTLLERFFQPFRKIFKEGFD